MNRKELYEWLATCPTKKYAVGVWYSGYIAVSFKVQEDEDAP